jgi:PEP-CTERM motif
MQKSIVALLLTAFAVVSPLLVSAAPITVPSGLNLGDQYRLAFVTSTTRNGSSNDIANYNAFVAGVAASVPELAALGTTWTAIGSTFNLVDARDNTGTNPNTSVGVPIYRLDDMLLALNNADLWDGGLASSLSVSEMMTVTSDRVWTGTTSSGVANAIAALGPFIVVEYGLSSSSTSSWLVGGGASPSNLYHLYAVSGVLTVVPEPSTLALAAFGFAALAALGWRRRGL